MLASPTTYAESASAMGVLFGDLTGDGRPEAFTTHRRFSPNQLIAGFASLAPRDLSHLVSPLRAGVESFSASLIDFDSDGDLDIFVASFGHLNLLHERVGPGAYQTVEGAAGMDSRGFAIAALPADFDSDGDTDLYVLNGNTSANELFRNDAGHFSDVAVTLQVAGEASTSGGGWADLDSDGDLDLLTTSLGQSVAIHENRAGGFVQVLVETGDELTFTAGVAMADVDLDGDIDAYLAAPRQADVLLLNESESAGNWLRVSLSDPVHAGTRIHIVDRNGRQQQRTFAPTSVLGTQFDGALHIGLGEAEAARVTVIWPDGQTNAIGEVMSETVLRPTPAGKSRDLAIEAVHAPAPDYGWGVLEPRVTIVNRGTTTTTSEIRFRVVDPFGEVSEQSQQVPVLQAGESTTIPFATWQPHQPGRHRFEFSLTADEVSGNDQWSRAQVLHGFQDVAASMGVADAGHGWAGAFSDIAFADFDRDGDQDLFLSKGGFDPLGQRNRLFHNDGSGLFRDVSAETGIDRKASSYAAVLGDYDGDGYVDLYVAQLRGQDNRLYRNNGMGFENVSRERQIQSLFRFSGAGGAFSDFDNDGDQDLYAGIFGDFDRLYTETGVQEYAVRSVGDMGEHVGLALADYDGDADVDLYVVNLNGRSVLYRNDIDDLSFVDVSTEKGTENQAVGTGCAFVDVDADGDIDLLVSNLSSGTRLYFNDGEGRFVDHAQAVGIDDQRSSRAVIVGDIDNDGDEDVYVVNESSPNGLYRNAGVGDHGFLRIRARGVVSNPDGIGARVFAHVGERILMREINGTAGSSYADRTAHFGLGVHSKADSVLVTWPSGHIDRLGPIGANSTLDWAEGQRPTAIAETAVTPAQSWLGENYPNPLNPSTRIPFSVATGATVRLEIFNAAGQRVRRLVEGFTSAGTYEVTWDGMNGAGRLVASGVYLMRLRVDGDHVSTRRMLLVR